MLPRRISSCLRVISGALSEVIREPEPAVAAPRYRMIGGILLMAVIVGGPSLCLPVGRDQGNGMYIGEVVTRGGAPYKDAWNILPPGIYYVYAFSLELFGKQPLTLRIFDLLWQTAAALTLGSLGSRLFGSRAGLFAGVLYLFVYFLGNDYHNLGNTDAFLALPMALALLAVLPHRRGPRWAWDLLAGIATGAALVLRFTHGLFLLPLITLLFVDSDASREGRWWVAARRLTVIGLGAALVSSAVLLHLVAAGAWDDFRYTLFVFAPRYAVLRYHATVSGFFSFIGRATSVSAWDRLLLVGPAVAMSLWTLGRERHARSLAAVFWLTGTFVGVAVMAKFYVYHVLAVVAPLSLLAGWFGQSLMNAWRRKAPIIAVPATLFAVYCSYVSAGPMVQAGGSRIRDAWELSAGTLAADAYRERFATSANYQTAAYLRRRTAPNDGVFIWGFETLIYFLADRRPPTRFCTNYPFIVRWRRGEWYEELVTALRARPPVYMVLASEDAVPWISGEHRDSTAVLEAEFPELRDFLRDRYQPEHVIGNLRLFRYRPPNDGLQAR